MSMSCGGTWSESKKNNWLQEMKAACSIGMKEQYPRTVHCSVPYLTLSYRTCTKRMFPFQELNEATARIWTIFIILPRILNICRRGRARIATRSVIRIDKRCSSRLPCANRTFSMDHNVEHACGSLDGTRTPSILSSPSNLALDDRVQPCIIDTCSDCGSRGDGQEKHTCMIGRVEKHIVARQSIPKPSMT